MNDIIKNMSDLFGKIFEYFKGKKDKSPLYKIFFYSYLICNWKMLYLAFWQNGDLFFKSQEMTKYEYLIKNYGFYDQSLGIIQYNHILLVLVCPLILTGFIIWIFPWFTKKALNKHVNNNLDEEKIINRNKLENKDLEIEIQSKEIEKIDKNSELIIKSEKTYSKEYIDFKTSKSYKEAYENFSNIIMRIDHYDGDLGYLDISDHQYLESISEKLLTIYSAIGLISKEGLNYEFTAKGVLFKKLFVEEGLLKDLKISSDISVEDIPF